MSLIAGIDTPERPSSILQIPVSAGLTAYSGNLIAINAQGLAVLASDTAGLKAVGRLENDVVNGLDYQGNAYATVRRSTFGIANSAVHPLAQANVGALAVIEDEQTVAATSTNSVHAGIFLGFDQNNMCLVDMSRAIAG